MAGKYQIVVLLYDVLHSYYFSVNERRKLLREVYRVLKPNALLSVYPEHMELEEVKREIEEANFWISSGSTEAPKRDFVYLEGVNG